MQSFRRVVVCVHRRYRRFSTMISSDELKEVKDNLLRFRATIDKIVESENVYPPVLVAVSKKKSVEHIRACYDVGQRIFGENYVNELIEKALLLPSDIEWHMIGHVTSSNVNKLLKVPNLKCIESVDSEKLAKKLQAVLVAEDEAKEMKAVLVAEDEAKKSPTVEDNAKKLRAARIAQPPPAGGGAAKEEKRMMRVFVQVNTSGEESKYGVTPDATVGLCLFIKEHCPRLKMGGLMTIGKLNGDPVTDFQELMDLRAKVSLALKVPCIELDLSMGMSNDYEIALRYGATNLRIGSTIFGKRT